MSGSNTKERYIIIGILIALVLGTFLGIYFPRAAMKLEFLGSLFFNALYMIIVPLIVASMIVGITALGDVRKLGRTARYAIIYFIVTSAVAVVIGITLTVIFKPGEVSASKSQYSKTAIAAEITLGEIGDLRTPLDSTISLRILAPTADAASLLSVVNLPQGATFVDNDDGSGDFLWTPRNIGSNHIIFFVTDRTQGIISETVTIEVTDNAALGFGGMLARIAEAMVKTLDSMIPRNIVAAAAETQVLALIVFSLLFGGALSAMGSRARPVIVVFEVINEAIMKLIHLIMYLAPFGVLGIVASRVADKSSGFADDAFTIIGGFSLVVIFGLIIHAALLMGALKILANRSPFAYLANMGEALLTAVGVSSSSATLPVTMECVVEKNKVDQRAASFVLPLGTTINMDGTAMYQAVSAIFVCQLFDIPLGIEHYVIMLITAILASIGTPGLPQAGVVMMSIVMGSVGVPADIIAQGVGIILIVDWALDRGRTALNVFGDSVGAAIIANTFEFKTAVARPRSLPPRSSGDRDRNRKTSSSSSSRSSRTSRSGQRDSSRSRSERGYGEKSESRRPARSSQSPQSPRHTRSESAAPRADFKRADFNEDEERKLLEKMVSAPTFNLPTIESSSPAGSSSPSVTQREFESPPTSGDEKSDDQEMALSSDLTDSTDLVEESSGVQITKSEVQITESEDQITGPEDQAAGSEDQTAVSDKSSLETETESETEMESETETETELGSEDAGIDSDEESDDDDTSSEPTFGRSRRRR